MNKQHVKPVSVHQQTNHNPINLKKTTVSKQQFSHFHIQV